MVQQLKNETIGSKVALTQNWIDWYWRVIDNQKCFKSFHVVLYVVLDVVLGVELGVIIGVVINVVLDILLDGFDSHY